MHLYCIAAQHGSMASDMFHKNSIYCAPAVTIYMENYKNHDSCPWEPLFTEMTVNNVDVNMLL